MLPPHEQVGYSLAPTLTTPANPVVAPALALSEELLSAVPESGNPLLALYSEAPSKTVLTLFCYSLVAHLLISYTPSFWWKLGYLPCERLGLLWPCIWLVLGNTLLALLPESTVFKQYLFHFKLS